MAADAAYQGAPGAYSETAARDFLGDNCTLLPSTTLDDVIAAVVDGAARHGVVPIENSLAGTVPNAYELLLAHDVRVIGERRLHIDHVLIAPPGVAVDQITRVLSHPVALAQCADFFRRNPQMRAEPVFDTAGAVAMVMRDRNGHTAALAARRSAELYGAAIVDQHLQDHVENWTRFLLVTRGMDTAPASEARKAILCFVLPHRPGTLWRALEIVARHGVDLTKIESRPIHGQPFEYRFFVELLAPTEGLAINAVIEEITASTTWLRVLGHYPPE